MSLAGSMETTAQEPMAPTGAATHRERVWLFPKGADAHLSANFTLNEFHCRCGEFRCHLTLVHPKLVETLQTLRELLARPLYLSSGFRCESHNERIGGRTRSYHTRGMAADVVCATGAQMDELAESAAGIPAIGAIGSYPGPGYLHLDVRPRRSDGVAIRWTN